jgi:hypothetical protein
MVAILQTIDSGEVAALCHLDQEPIFFIRAR